MLIHLAWFAIGAFIGAVVTLFLIVRGTLTVTRPGKPTRTP